MTVFKLLKRVNFEQTRLIYQVFLLLTLSKQLAQIKRISNSYQIHLRASKQNIAQAPKYDSNF